MTQRKKPPHRRRIIYARGQLTRYENELKAWPDLQPGLKRLDALLTRTAEHSQPPDDLNQLRGEYTRLQRFKLSVAYVQTVRRQQFIIMMLWLRLYWLEVLTTTLAGVWVVLLAIYRGELASIVTMMRYIISDWLGRFFTL